MNKGGFIKTAVLALFFSLLFMTAVFAETDENEETTKKTVKTEKKYPKAAAPGDEEGGGNSVRYKFKGYAKTLWVFSNKTANTVGQTTNVNRVRFDNKWFVGKRWSVRVVDDMELFTGNSVSSPAWPYVYNDQVNALFNLSNGKKLSQGIWGRNSIYRAYVTYESPSFRADVGKQRIAWGVMRYWRPTDFFNPESPLQIEGGERTGIDAFKTSIPLSPGNDLEAVFAPSNSRTDKVMAGKFHTTVGDYDLTFVGGDVRKNTVMGFTFDGYVGDGGFRGEMVRVRPRGQKHYFLWSVGGDYTLPNGLTLTAEYLNNGGAKNAPVNPLASPTGFLQTKNRQLASLGGQFQLNPLVNATVFSTYDIDGKSWTVSPSFVWNYKQNLELSGGILLFGGKKTGEFGSSPNTYYTQAKLYF